MTYAAQSDIEARYPGELAQAGPRDADGELDATAIALALSVADATIDRTLRVLGWTVPLTGTIPDWVKALAVDMALYMATPTALASQEDFKDRKARYLAAHDTLYSIAKGQALPPRPEDQPLTTLYVSGNERLFSRGTL